ncbi:MAG: GGDEF domain-containing protein [Clostridia bacterium]|nr:GGDEF domain-containing protein [Clostridia bacterium]
MKIITKGKTKKQLIEIIENLEKIAYVDNLTGAYNRIWFFENIKKNDKLYITMVDLNNLKYVNDTFGHNEGDKFIVRVANELKKYGALVRYSGGDEFLVLTKDKDQFDKLNSIVSNDFCCGGADSFKCTVPEAIQKADEEMYKCKRSSKKGRDSQK